jgi:predicted TIM-barrel fold metal-dependent hydrolase
LTPKADTAYSIRISDAKASASNFSLSAGRPEQPVSAHGPVVDCDVHHSWATQDELMEFVSPAWRERLAGGAFRVRLRSGYSQPGSNKRLDTVGPKGEPPGTDQATMARQLLDPVGVERAVLSFDVGQEASHPNPYVSAELARAANDWSIQTWLESGDSRHYGAIMVANQVPDEAAKEIRRVGTHPRTCEVIMTAAGLGMPLGHPVYHPIYRAAEELGLPIALHLAAELHPHTLSAGGMPNSRLEYHTAGGQPAVHHLASFITHGVFEQFPGLKFLLVEYGVSWVPWLVGTLDAAYGDLRRESPWVKRLPSEYIRDHVWMSSQPLELTDKPGQLIDFLSVVDGIEDMLCFASDYPHWDADEIRFTASRLPPSWRRKVLYENACRLYGWEIAPESPALSGTAGSGTAATA